MFENFSPLLVSGYAGGVNTAPLQIFTRANRPNGMADKNQLHQRVATNDIKIWCHLNYPRLNLPAKVGTRGVNPILLSSIINQTPNSSTSNGTKQRTNQVGNFD